MSSAAKSCFFLTNTFLKNLTKLFALSPSLESHVWVAPTTNQTHHFDTNIPGIPEIQVPLGQELKINIHKIVLGFNSFRIWRHLRVRSFLRSLISESLYFPVSFTNSLMTHSSFFYSLVLVNSISFRALLNSLFKFPSRSCFSYLWNPFWGLISTYCTSSSIKGHQRYSQYHFQVPTPSPSR